ncbi:MAG: hypothetical protein QXQ57_06245 [Sulfolobales archaeon]
MAQSSESISREPSIIEFEDGYWASIVPEDRYSIVSTDIPPILCSMGGDECFFEARELGEEILRRISKILGVGVLRGIMICTKVLGKCVGINVKLFLPLGAEKAIEIFKRARIDLFKLLADAYGPYTL